MSRTTKVTGPCFKATCARKAKVGHECMVCQHTVKACLFHREVGFRALQEHVMVEHPEELKRAKAGEPMGVASELPDIEMAIRAFEAEYGCPSAEVHARIDDGRLEETEPVCRWLMLVDIRDRITKRNEAA